MAQEDYRKALRLGQKEFRSSVLKGTYPYLQALDEILEHTAVEYTEPLGVVNIPLASIVGTKTAGRKTAFAGNFMPLLDEDTEFAQKWNALCDAHLSVGIRDPIKAYEYMNKFYVECGKLLRKAPSGQQACQRNEILRGDEYSRLCHAYRAAPLRGQGKQDLL